MTYRQRPSNGQMDRRTDRSKNNTLRDKCMEMLATAFTFAKLVVSFAQPG
jgi:hypothetical protein